MACTGASCMLSGCQPLATSIEPTPCAVCAEAKVAYIKPSILAGLLRDPAKILDKLVQLKQLLPDADVGKIAVAEPELLLQVWK
jgi:hypothetical protein